MSKYNYGINQLAEKQARKTILRWKHKVAELERSIQNTKDNGELQATKSCIDALNYCIGDLKDIVSIFEIADNSFAYPIDAA